MERMWPGTRALRTFDAAARHLNFSRAADEVGLTGPSAGIARDVGDATRDKAVASAVRTLAGDGACAIWCGGDRPLADTAAVVAQLDALGAR